MGAEPVQRQPVRRRPAIVAETRRRERLCARAHPPANRRVQLHASERAGATHVAMAAAAVGERQAVSAVRAVPSRARYRAAVSAPRQRDAPRAAGRLYDARYQVSTPREAPPARRHAPARYGRPDANVARRHLLWWLIGAPPPNRGSRRADPTSFDIDLGGDHVVRRAHTRIY